MIEKRAVVNDDPEPEGVVKEAMAKIIDNEMKDAGTSSSNSKTGDDRNVRNDV